MSLTEQRWQIENKSPKDMENKNRKSMNQKNTIHQKELWNPLAPRVLMRSQNYMDWEREKDTDHLEVVPGCHLLEQTKIGRTFPTSVIRPFSYNSRSNFTS